MRPSANAQWTDEEVAILKSLAGETDWAAMSPHAWTAEQPESVRSYCQEERRQAADRKKTRRARRRLLHKSTRQK
ncbi:hypothetical protein [Rhodopirellula sp. MGV]|uniref:hypothetical protein n=1 Tax=Rhodopirellula sp. MGV TaxID=2023130 RepID=UPI000B9610A6|nr:hypothetical protein [Rhodopirellula sp. MGV]OYP36596.1 hypothetical protein CGZ80_08180 [Rhodopirellula sp. MGV]PNY34572.1 hypothetical protein C2E31_22995 [Rhodopirellula baltica]